MKRSLGLLGAAAILLSACATTPERQREIRDRAQECRLRTHSEIERCRPHHDNAGRPLSFAPPSG